MQDYLITDISQSTAKNGSDYLVITLIKQDDKKKVWLWEYLDKFLDIFQTGDVVDVSTNFKEDYPKLVGCRLLNEADPTDYMDYHYDDLAQGKLVLNNLINKITDSHLNKLVKEVFNKIGEDFIICVGGLYNHHTRKGQLLSHTKEVVDFVETIATNYPNISTQVAIAGALLHDIGKVYDYTIDTTEEPEKTLLSHSTTHLYKGAELVAVAANDLGLTNNPKIEHIKHIINSHHLLKDWNAIQEPKTLEAQLVFFGDYFSTQQDRIQSCDFENGIGETNQFRGTYLKFKEDDSNV